MDQKEKLTASRGVMIARGCSTKNWQRQRYWNLLSSYVEHFLAMWEKSSVAGLGQKKKSCLVVLHRPPLIFKNWRKVVTVQRYTAPNFQNSKKKVVFLFLWEFLIFKKYFLNCCLQLVYILILVLNLYKDIFGKVDLFAPLLGDKEAIILCSFDFDLKKKKSARPPLLKKSCGGQPNNYFFRP